MRKPRDGDDTKQRVLLAAQALFAAKGFSGTSLADISRRCGISDGLILHHFQSKKNLYRQVLENLAEQYTRHLVRVRESATSPQEMMQQTLTASFDFWRQDSTYQRISLWAYLEGQTELAEKEAYLTAGLFQEVQRLQDQGIIDNRFSPVVILTLVIGPIHFWLRYREQFKVILNLSETSEALDQLFLGQLIQLVMEISARPS
ncbi:MAG: TetR/AcrR family transcriptional regulator [Anaerolineales bacterium]|nr:TetR/AcrR family transcriptional regulator [Anaerolineales bacterium]